MRNPRLEEEYKKYPLNLLAARCICPDRNNPEKCGYECMMNCGGNGTQIFCLENNA